MLGKIASSPFRFFTWLSETIEMGPRFATYQLCRQMGESPQKAYYAAMDITVNFRRHGTLGKDAAKIIPFFNAGVQATDKKWRWMGAEEKAGRADRKAAILRRMAGVTAAYTILNVIEYALNHWDDDKEKNYNQLSNYVKNAFYNIPLSDGTYFSITKDREFAPLFSLIGRSGEYFSDGNKESFDGFADFYFGQTLPSVVSDFAAFPFNVKDEGLSNAAIDLASGTMGSFGVAGTAFSLAMNKDFLGKPIISSSFTYRDVEERDKYNDRDSKLAYGLGQALDISPQAIDYAGGSIGGYLWDYQQALFPVGKANLDLSLGVKRKYFHDPLYSTDLANWLYDEKERSAKKANSHPDNIDAQIEADMDKTMTTYYSSFNKLQNYALTSKDRTAKQEVLDTITEYQKYKESGIATGTFSTILDIVKETGNLDLLPDAMNKSVKDKNKTEFTLSDTQYAEYQSKYNGYFYANVEANLDADVGAEEQAKTIAECKAAAKTKATNDILTQFSSAVIDRSKENAAANIGKSAMDEAKDAAKAADPDHDWTTADSLDFAVEYARSHKDISAEELFTESITSSQRAKYEEWTSAGGRFDNYDELLDIKDITADKNAKGNAISGSKKNKVYDAIADEYSSSTLRQLAWEMAGYKDSYSEYGNSKNYKYTGYSVR